MRTASTPSELGRKDPRKLADRYTRNNLAKGILMPRAASRSCHLELRTKRSAAAQTTAQDTHSRSMPLQDGSDSAPIRQKNDQRQEPD